MTKKYTIDAKSAFSLLGDLFSGMNEKKESRNINLLIDWNKIVGEDLGNSIIPTKIGKQKNVKTLFIAVKDLDMRSQLPYFKNQLLDKINRYLGLEGNNKIKDIKIR